MIKPPGSKTCQEYLGPFISVIGGYLEDPDASSQCRYCPARTTDQFLFNNFNMEYTHHWRNLGIVLGVTVFNVRVPNSFARYLD